MHLRELKRIARSQGDTCRILGTGPSARLITLPKMFTIGLNQAHRLGYHCDLSLTIHPELVDKTASTKWVVKRKKPPLRLDWDDPDCYVFDLCKLDPSILEDKDNDSTLYHGRGIHCSALHLARMLGFRNIYLQGVDLHITGGEHHSINQHVRYLGLPPSDVTREYYEHGAVVRDWILRDGGQVITLSPYLGFSREDEDHERVLKAKGMTPLPEPRDISTRKRVSTDAAPQ